MMSDSNSRKVLIIRTDSDDESPQSLEEMNRKLLVMNRKLTKLYEDSRQEQAGLQAQVSTLNDAMERLEQRHTPDGARQDSNNKDDRRMSNISSLWGQAKASMHKSIEEKPIYKPKPAWPVRLKEHFSEISMECLPNIISTLSTGNMIIAAWWTVLFLVMFGLNIGHTYYTLADYHSQPTVTNVIYKKTVNLKYPQLVICGHYMLDRYLIDEAENMTWLDAQALLYMFGMVPRKADARIRITSNVTLWWNNHLDESGKAWPGMMDAFYDEFGLSCKYLFSTCKDSAGTKHKCCDYFTPVYHMFYGRCWAQNTTTFPVAQAPGVYSFFALRFSPFNNFADSDGNVVKDTDLHIFYGGIEQTWLSTNKITIQATDTFQTWMEIAPNEIQSMPGKGYCEPNTTLEIFQEYTFANCMFEKQILLNNSVKIIQDRNCTPMFYEKMKKNGSTLPNNLRKPYYCGLDDYKSADGSRNNQTIEHILQTYNVTSLNPCAPPCTYTQYEVRTNKAQKDVDESLELLMLYTGMEYRNTVEKMRSEWYDYFSLIGGNLGLWLGASIVTFIYTFQGILVGFYSFFRNELTNVDEN